MIDKIGQEKQNSQPITYAPVIKEKKTAESAINFILYVTVVILFLAVISTYFVEDLPEAALAFKDLAIDALWVIVGGYAIGELFKRIFINKARTTEEYRKIREEAQKELNSLTDEERDRRIEYCEEYEENVYITERDRLLKNARISVEDFEGKYRTLSVKEIKALYPNSGLSKKQFKTIKEINALQRMRYNPDFLEMTIATNPKYSPSEMYNVEKEDRKNTFTSLISSLFGGFFGVSFAGEMIFAFSPAVLFAAVVKTIFIVLIAAFKANFGWNLVMKKEVNRFLLQISEAKNLKRWCKVNQK